MRFEFLKTYAYMGILVYLWGNIATYVISYYHFLGDDDATLSIASICFPLSWFF